MLTLLHRKVITFQNKQQEKQAHDLLIPHDPWILESDTGDYYVNGRNNKTVKSAQEENSHGIGE